VYYNLNLHSQIRHISADPLPSWCNSTITLNPPPEIGCSVLSLDTFDKLP
jgi:hypothetical protein